MQSFIYLIAFPTLLNMMKIVNLDTYPINDNKSTRYQSIIQSSISQLDSQGFVKLHNFLQPEIVDELTSSMLQLEQRGIGFYSNNSHNVFLEDDTNGSSSSTSSQSMNPHHIQLKSSKLILNAHDLAAHTELNDLFTSQSFVNFISSILKTKLYPSSDPYGKYYGNIFNLGDKLDWHFDQSEYSISLILQTTQEGGEFQFAPDSKAVVQNWDTMPLDLEEVSRKLAPHSKIVHRPLLAAGDIYIFHGQNSLHRVSEITKGTRINIILTYNTEMNVELNSYTLQKFFGVEK